jgi:hypothetical protein
LGTPSPAQWVPVLRNDPRNPATEGRATERTQADALTFASGYGRLQVSSFVVPLAARATSLLFWRLHWRRYLVQVGVGRIGEGRDAASFEALDAATQKIYQEVALLSIEGSEHACLNSLDSLHAFV